MKQIKMTTSQVKQITEQEKLEDKAQTPDKLDNILHEIHKERIPKLAKHLLDNIEDYKAWANLANSYFKIGDSKKADLCWGFANKYKDNGSNGKKTDYTAQVNQ